MASNTATVGLIWVDVTLKSGSSIAIKLSGISALDRLRDVVNIYHSGSYHSVRFDTEAEAIAKYTEIKAAII